MEQIESPAGLRVLASLIEFVNNKGAIEKVVKEIDGKIAEANKRIAVVGTVKQIDALKSQADTALAEANTALGDAKAEADRLLGKAGKKATAERERQRRADDILKGQVDRDKLLDAREKSCSDQEKKLQAQMNKAKRLHKEATEIKATADELMEKADAQLAVFRHAAASIN